MPQERQEEQTREKQLEDGEGPEDRGEGHGGEDEDLNSVLGPEVLDVDEEVGEF